MLFENDSSSMTPSLFFKIKKMYPDSLGVLQCTNYERSGTADPNSFYYIIMGGGDGCCVRNSRQSQECG